MLYHPPDEHYIPEEYFANQLRDQGNRYKQWHLDAFDRVYDKVDTPMSISEACRAVQEEMHAEIEPVSSDSFINMFHRYRREDEVKVRRILIIGAMMHNDMEHGVAQCARLSRRVDPRTVLDPH